MRFVFGVDRIGQEIVIDENVSNALIMGNREKLNEFYLSLIHNCKAVDDADYVLISKTKDVLQFSEPYKSFSKNIVVAFEQFFNEMKRRYETLSTNNCCTIEEYNRNGGNMKHLLLLVDDLDFIRDKKDALHGFIVSLLQKGRAVGIHLIIGNDRERKSYFFNAIKMNCSHQFGL